MEPKPHAQLLDWSNKLVNCRPIVERKWLVIKGDACILTIVRDGRKGVGNYEAIVVTPSGSRQTWGRNARNLLAAVKREL